MLDFSADYHRFIWYRFFGTEKQFQEPRFVISRAERLHASVIVWPAAGCLADGFWTFYPSEVVEQFSGCEGRDFLAEMLEQCHERDLAAIAHVNCSRIALPAETPSPDGEAGKPEAANEARLAETLLCANAPIFREDIVKPLLREVVSGYNVDGILVEAPHRQAEACGCEHCRERYRQEFAEELPDARDLTPAQRKRIASFNASTEAALFAQLSDFVHSLKPDIACYRNGGAPMAGLRNGIDVQADSETCDVIGAQSFLYDSSPACLPAWHVGCVAKYLTSVSRGKPAVTSCSYGHKPWDGAALPADQIRLNLADVVANGSLPLLTLEDTAARDERGLPAASEIYGFLETNRDAFIGTSSLARIALVWSHQTCRMTGRAGDEPWQTGPDFGHLHPHTAEFRGFYDVLLVAGRPFDVIGDLNLNESDLGRYETLVFPHVTALSDEAVRAVRAFVQQGGSLVVTGETSFCDGEGTRRENPGLADVLGIEAVCPPMPPAGRGYMRITQPHPAFSLAKPGRLVPRPAVSCAVQPVEEAKVLARLLEDQPQRFGPIPEETTWPGILVMEDTAPVVYSPCLIGADYWSTRVQDHRQLLLDAMKWVVRTGPATVDGALNLEISVLGKPGVYLVHLVNFTSRRDAPMEEVVPVHDARVTLYCPEHVLTARSLTRRTDLSFEELEEATEIRVPEVQVFETLRVEVEKTGSV